MKEVQQANMSVSMGNVWEILKDPACLGILIAFVTLQHTVYATIFFFQDVRTVVRRNHSTFVFLAYVLKNATVALGVLHSFAKYGFNTNDNVSIKLWGVGLLLFGAQLNFLSIHLLGNKGIYYGYELGLIKPSEFKLVTAYPYSIFPHPQYLGAVLQILAICCFFGIEANMAMRKDVLGIAVYMITLYAITIQIEKRKIPSLEPVDAKFAVSSRTRSAKATPKSK